MSVLCTPKCKEIRVFFVTLIIFHHIIKADVSIEVAYNQVIILVFERIIPRIASTPLESLFDLTLRSKQTCAECKVGVDSVLVCFGFMLYVCCVLFFWGGMYA